MIFLCLLLRFEANNLFVNATYTVLARKWRPQQFDELIGQDHVAQTLKNAIEQNRIAHAYLFCGPRGIGKTSSARIFAKALNCEKGPTIKPCDRCANCAEITTGNSMDVLEIDGASNRGIDEIRNLRENVRYTPSNGKYKIYIIDEVHMLTKEAFNALLKTLEEPPAHVKFLFATTEPEKMLPTILSRCQRFDLRRIPTRLIIEQLSKIAKSDKVKIEPAALSAIARGAEGGMRDAQSTLDQLISFCGDKIAEEDVLSMFGLAAFAQIESLATAILEDDAPKALASLGKTADAGKDLARLLADLLEYFRNLLVIQVSGEKAGLDLPDDELDVLRKQAKTVEADVTLRVLDILAAAEGRIKWAASKRILLELTVLKAIHARNAVSLDSVLNTLNDLRLQMGQGGGRAAANDPLEAAERELSCGKTKDMFAAEVTAETKSEIGSQKPETNLNLQISNSEIPSPQPSIPDPSSLPAVWQRVMDAVSRASPFTKSYLVEARPVSLDGDVFIIGYDPEFAEHKNLVDTVKHKQVLQTKIREVVGRDIVVKFCLVEEDGARLEVRRAKSEERKERAEVGAKNFKDDPLIKQALEIFKGTIVEVKA